MKAADWRGRSVAVWGAAKSGIAAANLLADLGAHALLSDNRPLDRLDLTGLDPRVRVAANGNVLGDAETLVPSPGISPQVPALRAALATGVRLVSEIELAASVATAPIVAISGTDGKSTTTEMIGACVRAAGRPTVVAGNIGDPLSARVRDVGEDGVIVAEVSAFQLWSCGHFAPQVAVLTNIAEDHADYFAGDAAAYAAAKLRVLRDLPPGGTAVLRADQVAINAARVPTSARRVAYAPHPLQSGFGLRGGLLTRDDLPLMPAAHLPLPGAHNIANALAALAAGAALGLSMGPMLAALRNFRGLPHRLEHVRTRRGVRWLDDSKATNPHAAAAGLRALGGRPKVVITGGYDKGLDLSPLVAALAGAHHIICMGTTAERTLAALGDRFATSRAADMAEAVAQAERIARQGDTVVLSPAASSFDQFTSYAHRGEVFRAAVQALPD